MQIFSAEKQRGLQLISARLLRSCSRLLLLWHKARRLKRAKGCVAERLGTRELHRFALEFERSRGFGEAC